MAITEASTKQALIDKMLEYWHRNGTTITSNLPSHEATHAHIHAQAASSPTDLTPHHTQQFPIHEMSRSFAKWFFDNLNAAAITTKDFWADVICNASFYENKCVIMYENSASAEAVHQFLLSLRSVYQLYLNLNDCFDGVQGRIDPHGLVLVLSCGTLHKLSEFVGTFEAVFGLLRDPFAENNWKIKQISLRLHNSVMNSIETAPTLRECDSMQPLLCLEAPACTIEEIE